MNNFFNRFTSIELLKILNQERKKFLRAIDYGSSVSDLEEIKETIKEIETVIEYKENIPQREKPDGGR